MTCKLVIIATLITYLTQDVTSQIYLPCDIIPVPGCSCHNPQSPIITCENLELTEVPVISSPNMPVNTLDLSHNNLTTIHRNSFKDLRNMKRLFLDHNDIESIRRYAFKSSARNLEWVDVSDNKLYLIPEAFYHWYAYRFPKLKILNLAGNYITYLGSDSFYNAVNLDEIHLERNPLANIHSSTFFGLSMLRSLSISMRHGVSLDYWTPLRGIEKLEHLSVSWVRPAQLDNMIHWLGIDQLKNLKHLEFENMNLEDTHFTSGNFTTYLQNNLKILSLRKNNLTLIPNQIAQLEVLTHLDLSDNLIGNIREDSSDLDILPNTLVELDIARNNLSYIDKDLLLKLSSALLINLKDNNLDNIDWTARMIKKAYVPEMILELGGNPWSCSCANKWLKKLVRKQLSRSNGHLRQSEIDDNLLCYSNVTDAFRRVADVSRNEFSCD